MDPLKNEGSEVKKNQTESAWKFEWPGKKIEAHSWTLNTRLIKSRPWILFRLTRVRDVLN